MNALRPIRILAEYLDGSVKLDENALELQLQIAKSNLSRQVPINANVAKVFTELHARRKSEYVFDAGINWSKATKFTAAICKRAGLRKLRFHDLRHSFASNLVMTGVSIYEVQHLLGHSSPFRRSPTLEPMPTSLADQMKMRA